MIVNERSSLRKEVSCAMNLNVIIAQSDPVWLNHAHLGGERICVQDIQLTRKKEIKKRLKVLLKKQGKESLVIDLSQRYHVISNTDKLLLSTNDFSRAWIKIQGHKQGTRIVRNDGELLAYASSSTGGRIKKGFPKKTSFKGKIKIPKGF